MPLSGPRQGGLRARRKSFVLCPARRYSLPAILGPQTPCQPGTASRLTRAALPCQSAMQEQLPPKEEEAEGGEADEEEGAGGAEGQQEGEVAPPPPPPAAPLPPLFRTACPVCRWVACIGQASRPPNGQSMITYHGCIRQASR